MTDTEIRTRGMKALSQALEIVEAEPFDYTKWRGDLFEERSIDEISHAADVLRRQMERDGRDQPPTGHASQTE